MIGAGAAGGARFKVGGRSWAGVPQMETRRGSRRDGRGGCARRKERLTRGVAVSASEQRERASSVGGLRLRVGLERVGSVAGAWASGVRGTGAEVSGGATRERSRWRAGPGR